MTPNKKAPERISDCECSEWLDGCEHEHATEYIRADLYDALKAKVLALALECHNPWCTVEILCPICKLKDEVRRG